MKRLVISVLLLSAADTRRAGTRRTRGDGQIQGIAPGQPRQPQGAG